MSGAAPSALFSSLYTQSLRGIAAAASLIAAIAMGISHETIYDPYSHHSVKIDSKDFSCYMYFLGIHVILSAYSLLVLALPKSSLLWQSTLASDMIVVVLLASINSTTLGMFYMEKNGNTHADWSLICDSAPSYCQRVMVSVVAGYVSLGMYFCNIIFCLCMALNPLLLQAPKQETPPKPAEPPKA